MGFFMRIVLFSVLIMEMCAEVRFIGNISVLKLVLTYQQDQGEERQGRTVLETEFCKYLFNPDGSCVVQYEGPHRPGQVTGNLTRQLPVWLMAFIITASHRKLCPG